MNSWMKHSGYVIETIAGHWHIIVVIPWTLYPMIHWDPWLRLASFNRPMRLGAPFFLKMEVEPASECFLFSIKRRQWVMSEVLKSIIIERTEEFITWLFLTHWTWVSRLWFFQKFGNISGMLLSRLWSSRVWYHVLFKTGTNVSEEHSAFVFRVEVCRVRNQLNYIGKLQERWPLRPWEQKGRWRPVQTNKSSEQGNGPFQGHRITFHHRKEMELL